MVLMSADPQNLTDQQKALMDRAKRGILAYLLAGGGARSVSDLHDYSMNKFFIQHQRFSQLMEQCVDEGFLEYDQVQQTLSLTESGRKFCS